MRERPKSRQGGEPDRLGPYRLLARLGAGARHDPRCRPRPPRPEAGQRPARRGRPQGHRLRHRQGHQRRGPHPHRVPLRHARLDGTRATPRRPGLPRRGRLRLGRAGRLRRQRPRRSGPARRRLSPTGSSTSLPTSAASGTRCVRWRRRWRRTRPVARPPTSCSVPSAGSPPRRTGRAPPRPPAPALDGSIPSPDRARAGRTDVEGHRRPPAAPAGAQARPASGGRALPARRAERDARAGAGGRCSRRAGLGAGPPARSRPRVGHGRVGQVEIGSLGVGRLPGGRLRVERLRDGPGRVRRLRVGSSGRRSVHGGQVGSGRRLPRAHGGPCRGLTGRVGHGCLGDGDEAFAARVHDAPHRPDHEPGPCWSFVVHAPFTR